MAKAAQPAAQEEHWAELYEKLGQALQQSKSTKKLREAASGFRSKAADLRRKGTLLPLKRRSLKCRSTSMS